MVETGGLEAGDVKFKPGRAVPMHHDGSGERGAPVELDPDGEGDLAVTAASADGFAIGQYADDPAEHPGRKITVRIGKLILVARAGGDISAGDLLAADGNGGFVSDGGTDGATPSDYAPFALEDATGNDLFYVAYP